MAVAGTEGDHGRCARLETDPPAKAENGVQDWPNGSGQTSSEIHGGGVSGRAATAEEFGPVRFEFDAPDCGAVLVLRARQNMHCPDRFLIASARPAAARKSRESRQVIGLQEQLGEGRMSLVGASMVEGHLCVAAHFQCARPRAIVAERNSPHLGIRIGRNRDLIAGLNVHVTAPKDRPVRPEDRLIVVGGCADRLPPSRPGVAALDVTDVVRYWPQESRVASSRQRVTSFPSQLLYPLPASVRTTL